MQVTFEYRLTNYHLTEYCLVFRLSRIFFRDS